MLQVLLVDDEYMIVEGLKKLIPFESLGMEVVAGVYSAKQALQIASKEKIDIVITDVNMPDMTGLEMIAAMKKFHNHLAFVILSGYRDFDYVKEALNLQVADYLVKPVNKEELIEILQKIGKEKEEQSLSDANQLLKDSATEEDWLRFLEEKKEVWIGAGPNASGFAQGTVRVLGQHLQICLMDNPQQTAYTYRLQLPYKEDLERYKKNLEKKLFYGTVSVKEESAFSYYEPIYRIINHGNIQEVISSLEDLEVELLAHTPTVASSKQVFIQLMMDVFHLFDHLDAPSISTVLQRIDDCQTLEQVMVYVRSELGKIIGRNRISDHVAHALEIITQEYEKPITIKDISDRLYMNHVYLGQLIKREMGDSFSELLNRQRIRVAQHLLLTTQESIEGVCYAVGYSNVGYFYKVFRRIMGVSPKAYRKQFEQGG